MGDRCYLTISIHGHIDDAGKLQGVINALEAEGFAPNFSDFSGDHHAEFVEAHDKGTIPLFYISECNYADIGQTEAALQALGVPYNVEHDEGGDYAAACWSWSPERGKYDAQMTRNAGSVIDTTEIGKALESDAPLAAVTALVEKARKAEGCDLPPFTMADDVAAFCRSMVEEPT